MAWGRTGDTAAVDEDLLRLHEVDGGDDRSFLECSGMFYLLATMAAANWSDYRVTLGMAISLAGSRSRAEQILDQLKQAGLILERRTADGDSEMFLIRKDELLHLRTRAERDWERQRDNDRRNIHLTVPVSVRDGDHCRYCGIVCKRHDNRSGRGLTYDHLDPGQAATIDTYVVACRACNGLRQDGATTELTLLPVPDKPFYSAATSKWLGENGHQPVPPPVDPASSRTATPSLRPETPTGTAHARVGAPARSRQNRPAQQPAGERARVMQDGDGAKGNILDRMGIDSVPDRFTPVEGWQTAGCRDGTGRDGSALAGTGLSGVGRARDGPVSSKGSPSRKRNRKRKGR